MKVPKWLSMHAWYLPHQAWLRDQGVSHHNPEGALPAQAILEGANLWGANLTGANLSGTILSPGAAIPKTDLSAFSVAEDGRLIGWRTRRSQCVGSTVYTPGVHRAPWFSVDVKTECHPGIYVCPTREAAMEIHSDVVRVLFRSEDALRAGRKYRVRELEVVE